MKQEESPQTLRTDAGNVGRGLLMGGADIVPGVSGGTVALILGIYERLITAISRMDVEFFKLFFTGKWKAAAERADLRFLGTLGLGIAIGIVSLASLMHTLLNDHTRPTLAVFFGLILASGLLVGRMIRRWSVGNVLLAAFGLVGAYLLVGLDALQNPPEGWWYLFICGSIAICAMILPGISGAFILLLLGQYAHVTGIIKETAGGTIIGDNLLALGVFALGCLTGLLLFSRVLKFLLTRFHDACLAVLGGVMLGSLRKLWPIKGDLTPEKTEFKEKQFENLPPSFDGESLLLLGGIAVSAGLVFLIDTIARRLTARVNNSDSSDY